MDKDNRGNAWTTEEENKMIALLAQTRMSSADCDTMFANMFGRTPRAIYLRRVQIGQRLLKHGHSMVYLCTLLHLADVDILPNISSSH